MQVNSCNWAPKRTRMRGSNTTSRKPSRKPPVLLQTVVKQYVRSITMQMSQSGEKPWFPHSPCLFLWSDYCLCGLFKVSILVNSDPEVHEIAFQYGRNVGIAFQVMFATMFTCELIVCIDHDKTKVCCTDFVLANPIRLGYIGS